MKSQQRYYKLLRLLGLLIVTIVAFTWFLLAIFGFSGKILEYMTISNRAQLQEVAHRSADMLSMKMSDLEDALAALAVVFSTQEVLHTPDNLALAAALAEATEFDRLRITTPDGKSFAGPGNMIDITDRDYFQAAMQGQRGISSTMVSLYNEKNVFVVFAPLLRNGKVVGEIHGACEVDQLSRAVDLQSFGGAGHSYLFQPDGNVLLASSNAFTLLNESQNIWAYLGASHLKASFTLDALQADVKNRKAGFLSFIDQNQEFLGYYTPALKNNWYLLQVVPMSVITAATGQVVKMAVLLCLNISLLFALLLVALLYLMRRSQLAAYQISRQEQISNQLLRIASTHAEICIFEYHLKRDVITFVEGAPPPNGLPLLLKDGPEQLIRSGFVDPEDAQKLRQLFYDLRAEEDTVSGVIKTWRNDALHWEKITLTIPKEHNPRLTYAVGTLENVTNQTLALLRFGQEEQFKETMLLEGCRVYEINLSQGTILTADQQTKAYDLLTQQLCSDTIYYEDLETFMAVADRRCLLASYACGITELTCDYRTVNAQKETTWSSSTTHILIHPVSGDVVAFTYTRNINAQKEQALSLLRQAQQDPLTNLYNRAAAIALIQKALEAGSPTQTSHAFLYIDLDNFKHVNDSFGHVEGDFVLQRVADFMQQNIGEADIAARLGGDEFLLFLSQISTQQQAEQVAAKLCHGLCALTSRSGGKLHVSTSIGIALAPQHGQTFEALYEQADIALYQAKAKGKNQFFVYEPTQISNC